MSTPKSFKLLCLENPLLDIQGKGDQTMLEKYNLKLNDTLLVDAEKESERMEIYDDLIQNRDAKLIPGGAAQNTARGAQYMLPADSVWYIGSVGADQYAETLRAKCAEQGLYVEYHVDPTEPTGKCGVVITDHHRTMLTHLAAANNYKLSHLQQPRIWSLVEATGAFYVGGYHLTVCPPAALALAKHAAAANKAYMLSLSAGFIPQFFKEPLAELLPYCDYVFGNENEVATWAATAGYESGKSLAEYTKLLAEVPEKVNKARPRIAICTQGTDPTIVAIAKPGAPTEVKEYPVLVIEESKIVDTNGAGDAFAGGVCAGVVEGNTLEESIKKGQWLARLGLQELGPS
ncbi:hypothetical protein DV736_g2861, partial [Chaetothyriales sp. CBS 134916]